MDFSTEDHHRWFAEFIRCETSVGGPDPHLATLGPMLEGCGLDERMWRCLLYGVGYNIPTAEVLWQHLPYKYDPDPGIYAWVSANWPDGFGLRRERRAVRTAEKFSRCINSSLEAVGTIRRWPATYDALWNEAGTKIYGMGRYVLLKVLEAWHRYCGAPAQDDIRAKGGKSPREGLSFLYPQHERRLLEDPETKTNVRWVEDLATAVKSEVEDTLGFSISYFTLQVVLCEYKKTFLGRQYPGRTHDTELRYYKAMQDYWNSDSQMLPARAKVFNPLVLGELSGWEGAREDLCVTLPEHGYMWNDLEYDYWASREHLEQPVRRTEAPAKVSGKPPHSKTFKPAHVTMQLDQSAYPPPNDPAVAMYDLVINVSHKGADEELKARMGDKYIYAPLHDSGKLLDELDTVFDLVAIACGAIMLGDRVLVHCWHGKNRSGFVNTLILREYYNMTTEQALARLREVRGKGVLYGRQSLVDYLRSLDEIPV